MSNTTLVAAMAMALTIAWIPAEAADGLSKKQVRKIVRQQVAKIQNVNGLDGMPFLFAHVYLNTVHDLGGGITQENLFSFDLRVTSFEPLIENFDVCFTGLPPINSGQATLDRQSVANPGATISVRVNPGASDCNPQVTIDNLINSTDIPGFYLLLY